MYYKLFSNEEENNLLLNDEQKIQKIIGNRLNLMEVTSIAQAYRRRFLHEKDFNKEHFFLDLEGYLKYKFDRHNQPNLVEYDEEYCDDFSPSSSTGQLLQRYDLLPASRYKNSAKDQLLYFSHNKQIFVKLYCSNEADFFYRRLMGTSQAEISKAINNDLLTAGLTNIAGEPLELIEKFLPISVVEGILRGHCWMIPHPSVYQKTMIEIYSCRKENILNDNLINNSYNDFGLVVRLDEEGEKRIYLVDYEFQLTDSANCLDEQKLMAEIREMYSAIQPKSLNYKNLIQYLPMLHFFEAQPTSGQK